VDNNVVELKLPYLEAVYKVLYIVTSAIIYPEAKTFARTEGRSSF
jgi:hypothetical protein